MHQWDCPGSNLPCFLFIYVVQDEGQRRERPEQTPDLRYCTVLAYGRSLDAAERVAINRVHQRGLRIVRADTATAAPWLDAAWDAAYLDQLARYGSALNVSDASGCAGSSATAA